MLGKHTLTTRTSEPPSKRQRKNVTAPVPVPYLLNLPPEILKLIIGFCGSVVPYLHVLRFTCKDLKRATSLFADKHQFSRKFFEGRLFEQCCLPLCKWAKDTGFPVTKDGFVLRKFFTQQDVASTLFGNRTW